MTDTIILVRSPYALSFNGREYRCAIGKGGFSANKKEGDGATPVGKFYLRECWYRADRLSKPNTQLPIRAISPDDGWCDDTAHPLYNRHFKICSPRREEEAMQTRPQSYMPASFEHLWRKDHAYDLIVPLSYNDDPIIPGKGSAIFLHIATPDYAATEGCVALSLNDWMEILPHLSMRTQIHLGAE